jgi:transcriptional regulator with XRE-family HTH domain
MAMPRRLKIISARSRPFIRDWRLHRNLTQEQLAEKVGTSKGHVSRIETGERPYTQQFLESCARVLGCQPADLIARNPEDPEGLWSVWEGIPPAQRDLALAVLRAFRDRDTQVTALCDDGNGEVKRRRSGTEG